MLGVIHESLGEVERSRALLEEGVAIAEHAIGPHHPELGMMLHNLAGQVVASGDLERARTLHERALAIFRALPNQQDEVAEELTGVATVDQLQGRHEQALAGFTEALDIREKLHGSDDPMVAASLGNLAIQLQATGEHARALPLLERALTIYGDDEDIGPGEELVRFAVARALVATGGDRARALAEAESSANMLRVMGPGRAGDLESVEAWLADEGPAEHPSP